MTLRIWTCARCRFFFAPAIPETRSPSFGQTFLFRGPYRFTQKFLEQIGCECQLQGNLDEAEEVLPPLADVHRNDGARGGWLPEMPIGTRSRKQWLHPRFTEVLTAVDLPRTSRPCDEKPSKVAEFDFSARSY